MNSSSQRIWNAGQLLHAFAALTLFCSMALFVDVSCLNAFAADSARRPNVLIILADDLGYADVGFQGCQDIPTPNIDALAKRGVRCTNGYVSGPYCSPTHEGLLTGRYQQRFGQRIEPRPPRRAGGVVIDTSIGLPLSETTIADRLKWAGCTGTVG